MNQDWNNRPSGERESVENMGTVPPMGGMRNEEQRPEVHAEPYVGTMQSGNPRSVTTPIRSNGTMSPNGGMSPNRAVPPTGGMQTNGGMSSNGAVPPAGFFIRLAAYLIDVCITGCIIGMIKVPLWFVKMGMSDSPIFQNILFEYDIFDILNFCLISAYFIIMTYISGKTLGKMLMKIQVVSETGKELSFGQVFFREVIGKYLSGILYIGYIMVGIQENKKGIHDMIADTKVVYQIDR